ncbi:hypothetical protein D3C71_1911780 [compost metagenome]
MLSIPPATTMSLSPFMIDCAASIIAFVPDAQTLFTEVAGINGKPANFTAWVAGACPTFADNTLPINTS